MSTVARPERTRLLEAMLEELVEKGYPAVDVEAAVQRARLDGAEWITEFLDKDACLVAAFEELCRRLRAAIVRGCMVGRDWPARVAGGLRALLSQLSQHAEMAEGLARTFPAIGPDAQRRYQAFVEGLAPLLREGREHAGPRLELPGEVEMLAVGAAEAIIFERIQAGKTAQLPALAQQILFSVLVPFLGPEQANVAMIELELREGSRVAGR
jgi:AcrR family transcriptional regulator